MSPENESGIPEDAKSFDAGRAPGEQPFEATKYNPEPGVQLPGVEQDDIIKEQEAELEQELGDELRAIDDSEFDRRMEIALRDLEKTRETVVPQLNAGPEAGKLLEQSSQSRRDAFRVLARDTARVQVMARIQNERRGLPPNSIRTQRTQEQI